VRAPAPAQTRSSHGRMLVPCSISGRTKQREAVLNLRPIEANPPAAERLSRMPTSGRHRAAARSVLDSRGSGGHSRVWPKVSRRKGGTSFSGVSETRSARFGRNGLRPLETTERHDPCGMHSQFASSTATRAFSRPG
jgi:hypothetical protein